MMSQLSPGEIRSHIRTALGESGILSQLNNKSPVLIPNAQTMLGRRYLIRNSEGEVAEDPNGMFRRAAHALSLADLNYGASEAERQATETQFYNMMRGLELLPSSVVLMNAGREPQRLSAGFVLPVEDSLDSIFTAAKQMVTILKGNGGVGLSLNRLRPEGDAVGSTGGIASGPVAFMRAFDTAVDVIKSGGVRRGAVKVTLNVDHSDILKFIRCKENGRSLLNLETSVAVTEEFMERVKQGEEYDLVNPRTGQVTGQLNAKEVFDLIADMAWKTGYPDVIFLDRINQDNANPLLGEIACVGPDDQPLLSYETCVSGVINLARMVCHTDTEGVMDWDRLARAVRTSVHLLDNVIDMNDYPIPEIAEMSRKTRRIGVGVMGFADLLLQLGVRYDSEEALSLVETVMRRIQEESYKASAELAGRRGTFPAWEGSIYNQPGGLGPMRNSAPVTIAPTGTISIIAGASSGIEPLFALSYVRNVMDNTRLVEGNSYFEAVAKHEGFYSIELMEQLAEKGSLETLEVPPWVKDVFRVSHDISPEWHVRMQAALQRHTDNSVSKTINFPHDATVADVASVCLLAYETGCKSITVYRDGSKTNEISVIAPWGERILRTPRPRPQTIHGVTERVRTGHGNMYITINFDEEGKPFEVFSTLGKAGGCDSAQLEAISRLVSLALRSGIDAQELVSQLRGITCCPAWDDGTLVRSGPDAVALALDRHLTDNPADPRPGAVQLTFAAQTPALVQARKCPDCNGQVYFLEGCLKCMSCGWNKCE